jgi:hypothetical protein
VPHFGTVQEWEDTTPPASDEQIAAEVFTAGSPQLAARLTSCSGLYAQLGATAPLVEVDAIADPELRAGATALFKKAAAKLADPDVPGSSTWFADAINVTVHKHPTSGRTLVSVYANNGGSCGDFSASLWHVYEATKGKLKLVREADAPGEILTAMDLNADGQLEYLIRGSGLGDEASIVDVSGVGLHYELGFTYNDCPC